MANKVNVDLGLNVTGYQQGLNDAIDSTQKYESELRKVKESTVNANKEFRTAQKQAKDLATTFALLDDEAKNSSFGKEIQRQMQEAIDKSAVLKDVISDTMETINNKASDTYGLDALMDGFEVVGGLATTVASGIAAVTGNQEDLNRALAIFGTVQSTVNTVTKIYNTLLPQSNLMLKIGDMQTRALAKAKQLETAETVKATVAQRAFNIVANANPYVLLATAVLTVVSALAAFTIISGKSAAAQEHENKMKERAKSINEAYYDGLNQSLNETVPKYTKLKTEWESLRTEAEKTQWIKDNQKEFENLGVQVNDVNDAENFLVTNTAAVMESFLNRAKAIGASQQAAALYAQYLQDIQWLEAHQGDKNLTEDELKEHGFGTNNARQTGRGGWFGLGRKRYELTDIEAEKKARTEAVTKAMTQVYKELNREQKEGEENLTNAGVKAIKKGNEKKNKARQSGSSENKKIIHKNSLEEAEEEVKTWETALKQANINDKELINRIQQHLKEAKDKVGQIEIQIGIAEPDPKDIPGTEAWYKENIKKLEDKKARLPIDAVLERDKIQEQIDAFQTKLTLSVGIESIGDKNLESAEKGTFTKSIQGYSNAISTLENQLQNMDYSKMDEQETKRWNRYIELILQYKEALAGLEEDYNNALVTPAQKAEKIYDNLETTISGFGSAMSSISTITDDISFNTAGIIAQTIAEMSLSFAKMLKTTHHWTEWLAFGVTGTAQLLSMISQIKSMNNTKGYATGGIIGGHSYYGDKILARLNSRELVLNEDQQEDAWKLMNHSSGGSNVQVTGDIKIKGSDLMLSLKNLDKKISKIS